MPFDKESGQIYHETTMRVGGSHCKCSPYRSRRGVKPPAVDERHVSRSLQDMAMRTLLRNLHSLDEEALRPLPIHMSGRLWSTIKYFLLDSVRIWQLFASVGGLGLDRRRWNVAESNCRRHGLKDSIKWSTSTSVDWLTDLTIFEVKCSVDDLMYIPELRNLRNLVVQAGNNDRSHISDSIVREWAFSTRRFGTLSHLQMMFFAGQNVTSWCLQYLDQFPSLDTFCVSLCQVDNRPGVLGKIAQQAGWSLEKDGGAFARFARDTSQDHLGRWTHVASSYAEHRKSTEQLSINAVPHLELNFGSGGKQSRTQSRNFSVTDRDFFCFERAASGSYHGTSVDMPQAPDTPPDRPVKRRKVKASKTVPLQQHIFFDE